MDNNLNKINEYYSTVDKKLLGKLCENQTLKNLIELSTQTDLFIFDKKNQQWNLKSKSKLKKECEQIRKKELKTTSSVLSNLARLNNYEQNDSIGTSLKIKKICENLENRIVNLDKILDQLDNINSSDSINTPYDSKSKKTTLNKGTKTTSINYIECYSNC